MSASPTHSPCNGSCVLDARGKCKVCLRTIQEIAHWGTMSEAGRCAILARIEAELKSAAADAASGPRSE